MTAIGLFDSLAKSDTRPHLARLAEQLIEEAMSNLRRIDQHEREYGLPQDRSLWLDVARSIWHMYDEWLREARKVLARVEEFHLDAVGVKGLQEFDDAIAGVENLLEITPERRVRGRVQALEGTAIPIEVIRDELQARLRGGQ